MTWTQTVTTYTLRNTTQRELVVLVDHPADRQCKLVETPDPVEQTERFDRFRVEVEAGAQAAFPVTERREHVASSAIEHTQLARQVAFVQSIGAPPELVAQLGQLEPIAAKLAHAKSEIAKIDTRVEKIGKQHDRIRKNLGELGSESQKERDLRERYIEALDTDETLLEELGVRRSQLEGEIAASLQEFDEGAAAICFG